MMTAGYQVPLILFNEINGSTGASALRFSVSIGLNIGTVGAITVMFIVVAIASWPLSGEKVKVVVPVAEVFIIEGDQVPVMPFNEVVGKVGASEFRQSGPIGSKVGIFSAMTVMSIVTEVAQVPVSGVKV